MLHAQSATRRRRRRRRRGAQTKQREARAMEMQIYEQLRSQGRELGLPPHQVLWIFPLRVYLFVFPLWKGSPSPTPLSIPCDLLPHSLRPCSRI